MMYRDTLNLFQLRLVLFLVHDLRTVMQSRKTVAAYLKSQKLMPFGFEEQSKILTFQTMLLFMSPFCITMVIMLIRNQYISNTIMKKI